MPDVTGEEADTDRHLRHLGRLPSSRRSRWDRPPPPHDWRWVVGLTGRVLISVGVLMFAFVAYQLWGTGIEYAQAQDRLDDELADLLAGVDTTVAPTTTVAATTTAPPVTAPVDTTATTETTETTSPPAPAVPEFQPGDAMARIEIPSIGLDATVVSGVAPADLKDGPGHYPDTPMPGQLGNAAIAGHRTTYGQPFFRLDEVAPGDEIVLTTVQGRFVYRMTANEIVAPSDAQVVATTDPTVATLTLTTCHPRYTAAKRLIVHADLDLAASAEPQPAVVAEAAAPAPTTPPTLAPAPETVPATAPATTPTTTPATTAPATVPATTVAPAAPAADDAEPVSDDDADAFAHGWFTDDGAWVQVALWGLVLTAIAVGAYLLSRRLRRNWVGALAGIVPFVIALYFFFQNVNRLLPAAL